MSEYVRVAPVLEQAAAEFAAATANPPYLFRPQPRRGPQGGRRGPVRRVDKPTVSEEWITVTGSPARRLSKADIFRVGRRARIAPTAH